jgi:hypothetical protein
MKSDLILRKGVWLQVFYEETTAEGLETQRIVARLDYRFYEKGKMF